MTVTDIDLADTIAATVDAVAITGGSFNAAQVPLSNAALKAMLALSCSESSSALAFDGSNDYVSIPDTTALPSGNSTYTLEAWIKPDVHGDNGIIGWGLWGNTNQVNALRLANNTVYNYWWGNDLNLPSGNLADGKWHHVAATYDGTYRRIYVDGVLKGSDTPSGHNVPSNATKYLALLAMKLA